MLPAPIRAAFFLLPALAAAAPEQPAAEPGIAYLCRLPNGRSVRTALPQGRCRPLDGRQAETAESRTEPPAEAASAADAEAPEATAPEIAAKKSRAAVSELPALWQEAVSAAADIQVAAPVPLRITLRRPAWPEARPLRPAPVLPAERPATPKEIISRDIRREERALARAERELADAGRRNQTARADTLRAQIADRRSGLDSLRRELRRHQ